MSIAAGEFRPWTIYNGLIMSFVIIGDFALIPSYGAAGAMFSKLTAIVLGCSILIYMQRHSQHLDVKQAVSSLIRVLISILAAILIFFVLRTFQWNAWIEGTLLLLIFFSLIHATRVISLRDTIGFAKRIRGNET
jgi:O-antigen/teichoic acid export membrane protein